ncbi:hypothetical protein [Nocardioides psychrotolerans]|uniref:hypothetical protein n=1 Tax=Nocardioides psychrotolerans TaxID=1005945 RepID=UPI003137E006
MHRRRDDGVVGVTHLGEQQQVLDHALEPQRAPADRGDGAAARGAELRGGIEQLEVADDGRERVLQLVRHRRDQLALVDVERGELGHEPVLVGEGARVEDGAAEVVADVERRVGLGGRPGRLALDPGQHQVADTGRPRT